ncbi:MAG: FAD-binding oxidoreductase, partial [Bacteroidia bacterium]|nr:FAD-binding oxidoreductase [Bacteroidia bacterium]
MQRISGWGLYPRSHTHLTPWHSERWQGSGIPRGLGRSYGDASFRSGEYTWHLLPYNRVLSWDAEQGILTAEAGLSLYEVIHKVLPQGWFPYVVPGTQFVTLGGAFASNIHGKNHHVQGSFADHVQWIELRLPSGELKRVSPQEDLFWATAGGMGLTGIIERLQLRLARVPTSYILNQVVRAPDIEAIVRILTEQEMHYPFAVAWIDHHHPKNRGIIHLGRFAEHKELPLSLQKQPFRPRPKGFLRIPFLLPFAAFNKYTTAWISLYYWMQHKEGNHLVPYNTYFFPLDGVDKWNRLWGHQGFVQFQFIVPQAEDFLSLWARLRHAPARSFLTVLKRLGPQKGPLAFSGPGWTLAIDLPATAAIRSFLSLLIDKVLERNGRIYLTKDSLLTPEQAQASYPEWKNFLNLKAQ